jgi:hypothetical protein
MYNACYKCGTALLDDYPSHFCKTCREDLVSAKDAIENLAKLLTPEDLKWLMAQKIRVDADLIVKVK